MPPLSRRVGIDAAEQLQDQEIDRELAEQAQADAVGSQVEQGYARSDVLERRREVMESWGAFLS